MRNIIRVLVLCLTASLLVDCDDDSGPPPSDDGATADLSATVDMAMIGPLMACLDRPDEELPRPPGPTLPCELIPPGLTL